MKRPVNPGNDRPGDNSLDERELIDEVRVILTRASDAVAVGSRESPGAAGLALMRVYADASARSPSGKRSGLIANWLIESSGDPTDSDSIAKALRVTDSSPDKDPLAAELHELIRRVAYREISDDDFFNWINRPSRPRRSRHRAKPGAPGAVRLDDAVRTLRTLIAETGATIEFPDPLQVWRAFQKFARIPVEGTPPESVSRDASLFQWTATADEAGYFEWDLTRQFTIDDESGNYDRMQQLSCTSLFRPDRRLASLGSGHVWSKDGEIDSWVRDVEALEAFYRPLSASEPVQFHLGMEQI